MKSKSGYDQEVCSEAEECQHTLIIPKYPTVGLNSIKWRAVAPDRRSGLLSPPPPVSEVHAGQWSDRQLGHWDSLGSFQEGNSALVSKMGFRAPFQHTYALC